MKKIILTESQARLLLEEIDKNDSIQKLIFCEPSDIEFEVSNDVPGGTPIFRLTPVVDGKKITSKYLNFTAEEVKVNEEQYYQLHIDVNEELRRLGIAYKLYVAFILQDYPVCSLFKDRNLAISGLWAKIANEPEIVVDDLTDENGNKIGITAYRK